MKLKRDVKVGAESTCSFKIHIRNLMNFYLSARKSQKILLYEAPFQQSIFWAKKYRGVIFHESEEG